MKCLILGSSGQIGSALCSYLKSQGHEIATFDIAKDVREDLRRRSGLLDFNMEWADMVFFLAFDVGGSAYLKTYQYTYEFLDNNTRIMQVVFDALSLYKKPFVFASTQMSNMTFSSYGHLKALGEFYTRSLNGIVVKFWNVYGMEHDPNKTHVITDFIKTAMTDRKIVMRTNGEEERQFLYSLDCCEALLMLANQYGEIPRDKELHVTTFKWIKIVDIAKIISKICGNVPVIPGTAMDTVQQGMRNEPDPYVLSLWTPKTDIETGIKLIYQEMKHGK